MEQSTRADQGLAVRPEARAREFEVVARLIPSGKKPKGNQGSAFRKIEAASLNAQVTVLRPETSAIYALVRRSRSSERWRSATVASLSARVTWV